MSIIVNPLHSNLCREEGVIVRELWHIRRYPKDDLDAKWAALTERVTQVFNDKLQ